MRLAQSGAAWCKWRGALFRGGGVGGGGLDLFPDCLLVVVGGGWGPALLDGGAVRDLARALYAEALPELVKNVRISLPLAC